MCSEARARLFTRALAFFSAQRTAVLATLFLGAHVAHTVLTHLVSLACHRSGGAARHPLSDVQERFVWAALGVARSSPFSTERNTTKRLSTIPRETLYTAERSLKLQKRKTLPTSTLQPALLAVL